MIALDIGGTKIACGIVDGATVSHYDAVPTPAREGAEALMDAAWALAERVQEAHLAAGGAPARRLAVASAGVIDPATGLVTSATDAIRSWAGTDVGGGLAARSGLRVSVLNDVHAHALGEFTHGRGRGRESMLLVAAGTGIGGGLIVNGELLLGANRVAGHVGHVDVAAADGLECSCGRRGHLEAVSSGTGIEQCFERATGVRLPGGEISRLAGVEESLSPAAREVLGVAGYSLGRAIGGLLNALDPGLVVLAGSVVRAGAEWFSRVRAGVMDSAMAIVADTELELAQLDNAALVGAAVRALREDD